MNGNTENCGSCRFWKRHRDGQPGGVCRERQPTAIMVGMQPHPIAKDRGMPIIDSFWPPIPEGEWCGQWEAPKAPLSEIDLSRLSEMPSA
jgi:hypothetical protein